MQSVVFYGTGDARLTDRAIPEPGVGEVRLKVWLAGVCATDRHILAGHFAVRPPRVLGHELVGAVDATGPDVAGWLGQTCGVRPARFCGACTQCRNGNPQLCQNFQCLGNTQDGGYAEYTLVPADQLVPLGELAPEAAVWMEPLACVVQALHRVGGVKEACVEMPGPVLILGAGVLGRLMVQTLRAITHAPVAVVDPNPGRVAAALSLGAAAGWTVPRQGPVSGMVEMLREWAPDGVSLIMDTSGSPEAIRRALEWAAPGGRVLLLGVSDPGAVIYLSPHQIFGKEVTLLASSGMAPAAFDAAVALLREGRVDPTALVTDIISLADLPAHLLGQAPKTDGKLLVRPGSLVGERH